MHLRIQKLGSGFHIAHWDRETSKRKGLEPKKREKGCGVKSHRHWGDEDWLSTQHVDPKIISVSRKLKTALVPTDRILRHHHALSKPNCSKPGPWDRARCPSRGNCHISQGLCRG